MSLWTASDEELPILFTMQFTTADFYCSPTPHYIPLRSRIVAICLYVSGVSGRCSFTTFTRVWWHR